MRRFPPRTLLLMALALVAFIRFYFLTHAAHRAEQPRDQVSQVTPPGPKAGSSPGAQACRTLEHGVEAVVRAPTDPAVLTRVKPQLDACPELPARACELGAALDARSPLAAGASPARELLETLCQRCPASANPCASAVTQAVMTLGTGRMADLATLRWNMEHAGAGTPAVCAEVTRSLLAPAALSHEPLTPGQKEALESLAPTCAKAEQLPANVLHAAVVQGQVPALAKLVQAPPAGEGAALKPDRIVGPQGGDKAFDGQEATSVALTANPHVENWLKEGAVSAVFDPPAHQVTALRVRASGPGTVHAMVRIQGEMGLNDPDSKTSFVNPVACRFRGTGQWETCSLPVALLDVEALSVFPDKATLTLSEVDARGVR